MKKTETSAGPSKIDNMDYRDHLSKDKKLKKLIDQHERFELTRHKNICLRLCASIMSQQLSTKVARVIHKRFLDLYGGDEPTPEQIVATPFATLRGIGLSNAKAQYVLNVAQFAIDHSLTDKKPQADYYIDDKAIRFHDWKQVILELNER